MVNGVKALGVVRELGSDILGAGNGDIVRARARVGIGDRTLGQ